MHKLYIYTNIVQYTNSCILYKNLDAFYKLPRALMRKSSPAIFEHIRIMLTTSFILAAVCVTLSIYSTSASHTCSTTNSLRLYNPNGNTTTEGGMLQICLSGIWTAACDYSFGCTDDGKAACRQLGYSGSQISMCMNILLYLTLKVVSHTISQ